MSDVLVIGFISIDFIGHAAAVPEPGLPQQATDLDVACGGRAANQAMAARAIELPVSLVARIGSDDHAAVLLEELTDLGVGTDHLDAAPTLTGVRLTTELPDGTNAITAFRGANDYLSVDDLNRRVDVIGAAAAVGVTTEPAGAVVLRALRIAADTDRPTILTHAPSTRQTTDTVLAAADVVVTSDTSCAGLLDPSIARSHPEPALRALVQRGARHVVLLTAGRALLANADGVREVTAPGRLESEDAVDAFVAGMLHGFADGEGMDQAVLRGVRTSCLLVD